MGLVQVSEGDGWAPDLFHDPNKSRKAITLVSNPSRQGEQGRRVKSSPKIVGMTNDDSDVV